MEINYKKIILISLLSLVILAIVLFHVIIALTPNYEYFYITLSNKTELTVFYYSDTENVVKYYGNRIDYKSTNTGWYLCLGRKTDNEIPKDNFIRFHNETFSLIFWNQNNGKILILTSDRIIENKLKNNKIEVVTFNQDSQLDYYKSKFDNYTILNFSKLKKENYFK